MIVILDASAAVEIVIQRKKAARLLHHVENAEWIMAPGLFIAEVTNVFWKYHQFGDLSVEQCEMGIDFSINIPDEISDDKTLHREAFSLGCQTGRPVCDMFYIVLARRTSGHLMTLDKTLAEIAKKMSIRVF